MEKTIDLEQAELRPSCELGLVGVFGAGWGEVYFVGLQVCSFLAL